jgi:hypothetical protein
MKMKSLIETMILEKLSEAKATYNNPKVESRFKAIKGKSKSELVDIYSSSHRIIDKSEVGKGNPKSWLVYDILIQEFGEKRVNESLDEAMSSWRVELPDGVKTVKASSEKDAINKAMANMAGFAKRDLKGKIAFGKVKIKAVKEEVELR